MGKRLYVVDWWVWVLVLGLIISFVKSRRPITIRSMYRITLLSSSVPYGYKDEWGGPDQYVIVKVDGKKVIRTSVVVNTNYVDDWSYHGDYSAEVVLGKVVKQGKRFWGSRIDVWLMDSDEWSSDDVIAHWMVEDPTKLEKLSTDNTWVRFKVKKLKEKEQLK